MKKIFSNVGVYMKYMAISPIIVVFETILDMLLPFLLAKIIDEGISKNNFDYVIKMGILMGLSSLISLGLALISGRFSAIAGVGLSKNLRNAIFSKVQDFSFSNSDKFNTATIMTRMTNDVSNLQQTVTMSLRMLIRAPIMLLVSTFMAIKINLQLSVVIFISLPILALVLFGTIQVAHPRFIAMFVWYDKLSVIMQEMLVAIREVKAFVREEFQESKFMEVSNKLRNMSIKAEKITIFDRPIMRIVTNMGIIAILWIGGDFVISGTMETGTLIALIQYLNSSLNSIMMLSSVFLMFVISKASIKRIVEILDEEIHMDKNINGILEVKNGDIEFNNVNFSYNKDSEDMIFNKLNLKIKSGETIGVIGGTGTGKSSLVQLIPRLYDVLEGEVLVGGLNVKDYKLNSLREEVAMVLQKNVLFSGTIIENLKWGNEEATLEEIKSACKIAQAHDFILKQPKGYNTLLDQGGTNLSGGQKQRICIARALLKNPKIIILDDSTSAVDTDTDSRIRHSFKNELDGITAIIIAQRISSVSDADKIIVLDNNGINGIGNHDELILSNEIYKEIYRIQQKGVA